MPLFPRRGGKAHKRFTIALLESAAPHYMNPSLTPWSAIFHPLIKLVPRSLSFILLPIPQLIPLHSLPPSLSFRPYSLPSPQHTLSDALHHLSLFPHLFPPHHPIPSCSCLRISALPLLRLDHPPCKCLALTPFPAFLVPTAVIPFSALLFPSAPAIPQPSHPLIPSPCLHPLGVSQALPASLWDHPSPSAKFSCLLFTQHQVFLHQLCFKICHV